MRIYAYTLPQVPEKDSWIKVGQTEKDADKRIKDQLSQAHLQYEVVLNLSALAGKRYVTDKDIHRHLEEQGFPRDGHSEWFKCSAEDVQNALELLKQNFINEDRRKELSQQFYEQLRNWYYWANEEVQLHSEHKDPDYALRIIVRLLLCFFLREKELVPREIFDKNFIDEHLKEDEHRYYNAILRNLFFHSLNSEMQSRGELENRKLILHYNKIKEVIHKQIPFLNGGLFTEHPGDDFALNDDYFFSPERTRTLPALGSRLPVYGIVTILSMYKYTLDETDNTEHIDPEFIGKTFECLLACIEAESKESRRKVTGSYYTPREVVDYMVSDALTAFLDIVPGTVLDEADENRLLRCAILDPACGSGAFPCGVMNAVMKWIDPHKTLSQSERYAKKLEILRNVIYGVDIQPMAVQIAVLRLFLSLLQEIKPTKSIRDNFGIEPLPNLDYKFVVADTLMGINGNDLFFREHKDKIQQLVDIKKDFFRESSVAEKHRLKLRIESLEEELASESGSPHIVSLCQWKHSDSVPSPYFDSRWMFGIEKFDIIIGNPPYGAKYPAKNKEYFKEKYVSTQTSDILENNSIVGKLKGSFDTFSLFIENGFNQLKTNGYLTFIVPLSVISSDSMTALHNVLFNNCQTIKVSSYAKRPLQIFRDSCIANTIFSLRRTNTKCERLWTTKMYRLTDREKFVKLLGSLKFADGLPFCLQGRVPKISLPIEKRILKKLFSKRHTPIGNLLEKNGKPVFYRSAGGRYYNVVTNYPSGSTQEKTLIFNKKVADAVGAILSSNLFWWYQQVYSDNLHIKSYEIGVFPMPLDALTPSVCRKIERLYNRYLQNIERHVIEHETQEYKNVTKYKEYKIRYSKNLIDKIDDIICPLYGLTEKELEFIKNYEIKFRLDGETKETEEK